MVFFNVILIEVNIFLVYPVRKARCAPVSIQGRKIKTIKVFCCSSVIQFS